MEYTGWLYDENAPDNKGHQYGICSVCESSNVANSIRFDSSVGRGDFKPKIGVGQVIKGAKRAIIALRFSETNELSVGWDEGVVSQDGGMSLGEKSTLTITG